MSSRCLTVGIVKDHRVTISVLNQRAKVVVSFLSVVSRLRNTEMLRESDACDLRAP